MDFLLNVNLELSLDYFKLTFMRLSHLSTWHLLNMIFEHLWIFFDPKDLMSGFF